MTNRELQVVLTLKDELSQKLKGAEGAVIKFGNSAREFGLKMRAVGRGMSNVGMSIAAVGTAITAPLAMAYKTAGNFNADISRQLDQTQNVFNNLSLSIGKSLLPVMKQLTDSVANAVGWWNNLEQATRDKIIQNIWNLGKGLVMLGISLVVIGKTIATLGTLSVLLANFSKIKFIFTALTGPVGWVIAGFVVLTACMLKWKAVSDTVINTTQNLVKNFTIWGWLVRAMAGQAGIEKVFGKSGDWAKRVNDWKQTISEIMGPLTAAGKDMEKTPGSFWSGFEMSIKDAEKALKNFQQLGIDVANQLTTGLASAFSSFIDDAFSGQLKRAQDYFAAFGQSILKMFGDVISKMIAQWLMVRAVMAGYTLAGNIMNVLGSIGGIAGGGSYSSGASQGSYGSANFVNVPTNTVATPFYHSGGIVRAHGGLAIDEVPIIAQTGERILSRKQNAEYEKGNGGITIQPVVIIKAWDFADVDKHKPQIIGIIGQAITNNGALRNLIKKYA